MKPTTLCNIAAAALCIFCCACKERKRVDASSLSTELYLKGKGFYVLSNETGFLAIEAMAGTSYFVSMKTHTSSDGVAWSESANDWVTFRTGTNIVFGDESVTLSWEGAGQTRVSGMLLSKTGIATVTNTEMSSVSAKHLSYTVPIKNGLMKAVEEAD